jgi:hypothetical protein
MTPPEAPQPLSLVILGLLAEEPRCRSCSRLAVTGPLRAGLLAWPSLSPDRTKRTALVIVRGITPYGLSFNLCCQGF